MWGALAAWEFLAHSNPLGATLFLPSPNMYLLPDEQVKAGGKLCIVNLQRTPRDHHAGLRIHGRSDQVMALVARQLGLMIPDFLRKDQASSRRQAFCLMHTQNGR